MSTAIKKVIILFFFCTVTVSFAQNSVEEFVRQLEVNTPQWMITQVEADLSFFKDKPISLKKMHALYDSGAMGPMRMRVRIQNNQVFFNDEEKHVGDVRFEGFASAFRHLSRHEILPDITLLISTEDGLSLDRSNKTIPLFTGSKEKGASALLIPDFEVLRGAYQVLKHRDITSYAAPWKKKKPKLIWRGSTAQQGWRYVMTEETLPHFSRVTLCQISKQCPDLIDAKFTIFAQGGEFVPSLQQYKGDIVPYEVQLMYKYHILIDGNVCSYTCSGWRFLSNSLVFIPDSPWIQWYHGDLEPYVHYVPVASNLSDLPEKIVWAIKHDSVAQEIGSNGRNFALTHITRETSLQYLHYLIWKYATLNFVETE